jgi:iron complex transport system ATP-binding protein
MIAADGFFGKTTPEMKREHGEAYPIGTETVAAPATVSGERRLTMPLAISREGKAKLRPASQETCHRT